MSLKYEIDIRLDELRDTCGACNWRLKYHGLKATDMENCVGELLEAEGRITVLETLRDALYGE
jgi:hypothetical protein